jgi:acetyltransferase-like isoleucine patch superfamily enzyme
VECEGGVYYVAEDVDIDSNSKIGPETKIWSGAKIFPEAEIGMQCVIGAGVHIERGVKLGNFCKVQRGVTLYSGIETEDYVFFGPNVTTTNDRNPRAFGDWELSRTKFEIGCSMGANATIIAGIRIGALSLIGAGAVVTKDVEPCSLVHGNPARRTGWVDIGGNVIAHQVTMPESLITVVNNPLLAIENYLAINNNV